MLLQGVYRIGLLGLSSACKKVAMIQRVMLALTLSPALNFVVYKFSWCPLIHENLYTMKINT